MTEPAPASGETARILLLEDNPGDARLVRAIFEEDGVDSVEIVHVTRLAEAEGRLERGTYDAALVDLTLPDSMGIETLVTLHTAHAHLPLVVVTGSDDDELRQRAFDLGAFDWVFKDDLDGARLVRSVASAIMRSRLSDALEAGKGHGPQGDAHLFEFVVDAFEPIVVLSDSRHVLFANPAAGAALGVRPDRLIGMHLPLPIGRTGVMHPQTPPSHYDLPPRRVEVRSFRVQWNDQPAWLVALGEPRGTGSIVRSDAPMLRGAREATGELAAQVSETQARAHFADTALLAVADHLEKATGILHGLARHRSPEESRTLLLELLGSAARAVLTTRHEVESIDRMSARMIRCLNRNRRVHERCGFDGLVRRACARAQPHLPATVQLRFDPRASGAFVTRGDEVVGLTMDLLIGLGDLACRHSPTGADLHLESRAGSSGTTLSFTVEAHDSRRLVSAEIVEALVAGPRHGHDALAAATQELRALEGDLRIGERSDGAVWLELRLP